LRTEQITIEPRKRTKASFYPIDLFITNGPSTPPSNSPEPFKNVECSNCKLLL
nr:hypothetical protein [Tanacetum cinerariifolium]